MNEIVFVAVQLGSICHSNLNRESHTRLHVQVTCTRRRARARAARVSSRPGRRVGATSTTSTRLFQSQGAPVARRSISLSVIQGLAVQRSD
jgi:hypothetical protein